MATNDFSIYLVGGAVRDKLLQRPVHDRDYVVVGADAASLMALGYTPVGKDFPVFLHPHSKEEYALARTERKRGHGYHGFVFHAAPDVSLEQDLKRRDLTINAMAEDAKGQIIDPFNGQGDLKKRVLRHVSPSFAEDPLRILRVARFAARFAHLGFTIAPETVALMQAMVASGEAHHLVAERVWLETQKALREKTPSVFIQSLHQCAALAVIMPAVAALYGIPQNPQHHPEIDTGKHLEQVLDRAAQLSPQNDLLGFCALTHDLGKGVTPKQAWPHHHGHEHLGVPLVKALCKSLNIPKEHTNMATICCREHLNGHRIFELDNEDLLALFERMDVFRRPERLVTFSMLCQADSQGRLGYTDHPYPQAKFIHRAFKAIKGIKADIFIHQGLKGKAIGQAMRQARLEALATFIHQAKD